MMYRLRSSHEFLSHRSPYDVPFGSGAGQESFDDGHDYDQQGPPEPDAHNDQPPELEEQADQPAQIPEPPLPPVASEPEGRPRMDAGEVSKYLEHAKQVSLATGAEVMIPVVGGFMPYTRPDYRVTRSDKDDYTQLLFGDQYAGTAGLSLHLQEDQSEVVSGGLEATFAPGQVVLVTGSAEAIGPLEYSREYPDAVIIGVDNRYAETREIDTQMPGVQLTGDDWSELPSIPTGSVNTILSVLGPELHGEIRADDGDKPDFIDAWDRVASDDGTIRFYVGMPWIESVPVDRIRERLESLGWEVTRHGVTVIATRRSDSPEAAVPAPIDEASDHPDTLTTQPAVPSPEAYQTEVAEYLQRPQVTLVAGDTLQIPTVTGTMDYTCEVSYTPDGAVAYKLSLFRDDVGPYIERPPGGQPIYHVASIRPDANPVAGGIREALGPGKRVLDIGPGGAFALHEFADEFPDAIYVGIDTGYAQRREPDLNRPGVHLTQGDWDTLDGIPDNSMDTILAYRSVLTWGESIEASARAITRVAKLGAVFRYVPFYERTEKADTMRASLEALGWEITIRNDVAIAVKIRD